MRWAALLLLLQPAAAQAGTFRVAVAEFVNGSADKSLDPLGKGLQSMVATDLSHASGLELVERQRFAEIVKEQNLSLTGYLDRSKAVQMGKLLGATHLVTGSFVVVGAQMRIDVRLFDVKNGKVLLAEEAKGDREAFFEVEKAAVDKLIGAVGIRLSPKERAKVGRVHTADFDAFREFSEGVALFDQAEYDQALKKLQAASARDEDFKLAKLTIGEYETLISQVRARATEIEQTSAELSRLKHKGQALAESKVAEKLFAIANRKGKKHARTRLTALYLLAHGYGGRQPGFKELRAVSDEFLMERMADRFAQRYFYEAREHWPKCTPIIDHYRRPKMPGLKTFEEDFDKALFYLFGNANKARFHLERIARFPWGFDLRLYISRKKRSRLFFSLLRDAERLDPKNKSLKSHYRLAARRLSEALLFDESTTIYRQLTSRTDRPLELRMFAKDIERNKEFKEALANAEKGSLLREWLILTRDEFGSRSTDNRKVDPLFAKRALTPKTIRKIALHRRFSHKSYVMIGAHPVWPLAGRARLYTGPRSDFLQAESLRYYGHPKYLGRKQRGLATAIVGGQPAETVSFEMHHQMPEVFFAREVSVGKEFVPSRAIPSVGVLLGVADVKAPGRPMRGWLVTLQENRVKLLQITDTAAKKSGRWVAFNGEVHDEATIPAATRRKVAISVDGRKVSVTLDGKTHRLSAKEKIGKGLVGFRFLGNGFVEIKDLKVK